MIASIARFILDPFHILIVLLICSSILFLWKNRKASKWLSVVTFVWFLIITTPYVPYWILNSLENTYDPLQIDELDDPLQEYHIVIHAAGFNYNERLPYNSQLSSEALGRLIEGIRLYKQLPNSKLVASGPYDRRNDISQAEVMKKTAMLLGVKEENILMQSMPVTTAEEVKVYYYNHYKGENVIVVTSAFHMHRTINEYKALNIPALPSPTNYRYRSNLGLKFRYVPNEKYIDYMRRGVFEYAALFRNRFLR